MEFSYGEGREWCARHSIEISVKELSGWKNRDVMLIAADWWVIAPTFKQALRKALLVNLAHTIPDEYKALLRLE